MRFLAVFTAIVFSFLMGCNSNKPVDTASQAGFKIERGVNTSHWLSQTEMRGAEREAYMQAEDFEKIAEMGFDHVRIPVDEMHLWAADGSRNEEAFALLHEAIKWSLQNELRVIVDLHVLRSHHFNTGNQRLWTDPAAQEQFWGFWKQLSDELKKYPVDMLAYELLNEAVAENPDDWNKLIAKGIEVVREREPLRKIVVGSNKWQQVYSFKDLKVPENDTNLILSFHFYEPFLFTHYKASWTGILQEYDKGVQYPGLTVDTAVYSSLEPELANRIKSDNEVYNKDVIEEKFLLAVNIAEEYGLPLYCGEFGCFPTTPMEMRVALYEDLASLFKKYDIAWTHWNYKNDFPIVDAETLDPVDPVVNALMGK